VKKKNIIVAVSLSISVIVLIAIFLFIGDEMEKTNHKIIQLSDLTKSHFERFNKKKFLFGHQSVGANIIQGLNEISDSFNIVKSEKNITTDRPAFRHFRVTKNGDPISKIDHFIKVVSQSKGIDIALMKLCYADILDKTDFLQVFNYYKKNIENLKNKYPNIKIIHSTIPIYSNSGGIKAKIKHLFKLDKNINRNKYNELMRKEYNKNILFDLALFESTFPDGRREKAGNKNYSLIKAYSDGGGHLNRKGREIITSNFIYFISKL